MDFKKFYFSPEGRVNRKQWWLWTSRVRVRRNISRPRRAR